MSNSISYLIPPQAIELPEFWNLIFISGQITSETAEQVCQRLLTIEMINKSNETSEPVNLIINSPGGDLNSAWQICDVMDFIQTPIHTVGMGQICSAGLIIAMNGEFGYRKVTDRTSIMSHTYSWGSLGPHGQLMAATEEMKYIQNRLVRHYEDCTGLSKKEILDTLLTDNDTYLTPMDAKKYNLIDTVVVSNKTKKIKKMIRDRKAKDKK